MRLHALFFVMIFAFCMQGCSEEQKIKPAVKADENIHPRLSDLNPNAWNGLSMEVIISDFQESDGIFTSFICDEINKRLSVDPLGSLQALNEIDKKSRNYVFKICLSPESEDPSGLLKAMNEYSSKYPDLVKEVAGATQ